MNAWAKDAARDKISNLLDEYRQAVDKRVCAEIDAGCCRTQRDYDHKHKCEDAEDAMRTKVEHELFALADCLEVGCAGKEACGLPI